MDLAELLDVTEPVTLQFMEHAIVIHVYTAGRGRLTREEKEALAAVKSNPPGEVPEGEEDRRAYNNGVDLMRAALPIMLKGVDLDGTPLTYNAVSFPENVGSLPDSLLVVIGDAALDAWNKANPTDGEAEPIGSEPTATPEQSQTLNTVA